MGVVWQSADISEDKMIKNILKQLKGKVPNYESEFLESMTSVMDAVDEYEASAETEADFQRLQKKLHKANTNSRNS
jgi:hypothetical protein